MAQYFSEAQIHSHGKDQMGDNIVGEAVGQEASEGAKHLRVSGRKIICPGGNHVAYSFCHGRYELQWLEIFDLGKGGLLKCIFSYLFFKIKVSLGKIN